MKKKQNLWISFADLFSGVVLVVLLLFVMSIVAPKYKLEQQRTLMMSSITNELNTYETTGQLKVHIDESMLEFTSVTFEQGSAKLSDDTLSLVKALSVKLKQYMQENPTMEILIEGHTDPAVVRAVVNRGGYFENNIQLSSLRAINVRSALLTEMGDEFAPRIGVAGYGETRLRNKEDVYSPENRRIEIRILWEGNQKKLTEN